MNPKIRPQKIEEIIGLERQKTKLLYLIQGAMTRGNKLPHILLSGPPGVGKTTIAKIMVGYSSSRNKNATLHEVLGINIRSADDVYNLATMCQDGDVVFIEECGHMRASATTVLLPWLEDCKLVGAANMAAGQKAPNVSFVLATTNAGKLTNALRSRCNEMHLSYYSIGDIKKILVRAATIEGHDFSNNDEALTILAESCRGTPRIALEKRLDPLLDVMAVDNIEFCQDAIFKFFAIEGINLFGLDQHDILYCETLYKFEKESERPVAFRTLVQATGLEEDVVTNIIESYLLKSDIIRIESRGRTLTNKGLEAIGREKIIKRVKIMDTNTVKTSRVKFTMDNIHIDESVIMPKVIDGSYKTIGIIAEVLKLPYVNPCVRASIMVMLNKNGYTSRRKTGIIKLGTGE